MSSPSGSNASACPIVLIPGLACSPRLFAPQWPVLWRHGSISIASPTRHASIAALAAAILEEAPPRFILMGLSMGGYISFEILRQAPRRVAALAILDSSARADTEESRENRQRMIALAAQGKLALATELSFPRSVHPQATSDATLRQLVLAMAEDTGSDAYIRQQTAIAARPDARAGLAAIACPTLIIVGDSDALTPPELAEEMHGLIPRSELAIIPRCGHLSTLEQPELVNQVLQQWLARLP